MNNNQINIQDLESSIYGEHSKFDANDGIGILVEMAKQNRMQNTASASTPSSEGNEVPLWEKYTLTIREAAAYFHIGEKRLRMIVDENPLADYLVMNGNRALIIRSLFEKYINESSVV